MNQQLPTIIVQIAIMVSTIANLANLNIQSDRYTREIQGDRFYKTIQAEHSKCRAFSQN